MMKSTNLLLLCMLPLACGEVSGEVGGTSYLPSIPSNAATATPNLLIAAFSAPLESVQPGGSYSFMVTLEQSGCTGVAPGQQLFVHFVSPDNPEWFEFALYPVPAPPSETWGNSTVILGTAVIPTNARGTYDVEIGINNGQSIGDSQNIPLLYRAPVAETFGAGDIGFRYRVATIQVSASSGGGGNTGGGANPGAPSGSLASTVIDNMQGGDDGQLIVPGTRGAGVQMGLRPNGHQTPTYWPASGAFENSGWWRTITPWWNVLPVVGNSSHHTRIEIGRGFTLTKTAAEGWRVAANGTNSWAGEYDYYASNYVGDANMIAGTRGDSQAFLPASGNNSLHGGHGGATVDTPNLTGLISCVQARLIVDSQSGIDDRSSANFIMWVGLDFYPDQDFHGQVSWGPASATSRRIRLTNDWQLMCMAPLDNPGRPDPENYRAQVETFSAQSLSSDPPSLPAGF